MKTPETEQEVSPEDELEFIKLIATMCDGDLCKYIYQAALKSTSADISIAAFRNLWIKGCEMLPRTVGLHYDQWHKPNGYLIKTSEMPIVFYILEELKTEEEYRAFNLDNGDFRYFQDRYRSIKDTLSRTRVKRVPREIEIECWTMALSAGGQFVQNFAKNVRHYALIYAALLPEMKAELGQTDADVTESLVEKLFLKSIGRKRSKE
jgi:hypothetical protein